MRISAKQYSKALYDLTKGKDEKELDSIVFNFASELRRRRKLNLSDDIMKIFSEIYNKENRIMEAEIVSAREIGNEQMIGIKNFLKNKYGADKVILDPKMDKNIKGGIIIRMGEDIIDGSILKKMKKLNNLLKNNV
ncbi:MAG: ATP synthase F1 subunit delta [Candidatus Moranbacteria bacterium]|jgi:F-type H+-transporting ATPase subunit delta|nr:ATP synthase F1 subunit delta [Candidatus Moranbacteria bacterium]MDD5651901.1 ATP synthase F1 subunit delta [Candidatus Moranbacteria bacterium]MDX9855463.1 ATP synthase F1 subunit delta [Candidatus Moranbacteria bacterium]